MPQFVNSMMSSDIVQRGLASPRTIFAGIAGLVALIVTIMFTKEVFIVLSGLLGAASGYLLHNLQEDENPVTALRSVFNMRRSYALALGSALSAFVALWLFWAGIRLAPEQVFLHGVLTCGAYAFFSFSLSSYVFGRYALSRARHKLAKATIEQGHIWHRQAQAARSDSVARGAY